MSTGSTSKAAEAPPLVGKPVMLGTGADSQGVRIDADVITTTITRALAIRRVLPRHEELEEIEAELRGHLRLLIPAVPDAGRARAAIAAAELDRGPGPGLQSATNHVQLLALDCRWLLRYLGREGEGR
ncbi:DUF6415 family natural product biosynthesis protein [Streptomyces sp. TRM 70361]|uniref:DUF6415 family natural product biosynthesis protein n=1 Tax=Streptomyces sp. TRM 70361 TaxID=3116553 RepID=UPI002E7B13DD|nr:DUF6415 family natural product biosynthesis protein [Streptomyces sp. TRM 70361]MEE1938414.1 DUF6415 family natural product biosynthesis protein [Streptomyces sp. TRM 70361]